MIKLHVIYFWLNYKSINTNLISSDASFYNADNWVAINGIFYLLIYLFLQFWIHALPKTFHEIMACSLTQYSTSVRPCTYRWSPDPVWSLSLTLSPQFPPRTVKLSTQNFSITPFSGRESLVQVYLRYKFNRCILFIL